MDRMISFTLIQDLIESNNTFSNFLKCYEYHINIIPRSNNYIEIADKNNKIIFNIPLDIFDYITKINQNTVIENPIILAGGKKSITHYHLDRTYPKSYYTKVILRQHLNKRPFKCSWVGCSWSFKQLTHLKSHLRCHTKEKPFTCPWLWCGWKFGQASHLKVHIRRHTGEKPYECSWNGCSWKFSQSGSLTKHIKRCHLGDKIIELD